ncbi:ABC transporter ATP-binding protein [Teredinibacter turnerae]|uniref:ABC transporter ATP-binding protein n=1 Tax=Teredinibacter turnerae TaxID=2426 RepID=UPI00036E4199|nr:ABC transporter ATP-binding protein [Teredinibacter turnerae]
MNEPKRLIEISGLTKIFHSEVMDTYALTDVNININTGEFLAITGSSGSGKSTLLSLLGLLDVADSGMYKLSGIDVIGLDGDQRSYIRNKHIGFIFQSFHLISNLSVHENVALPLTYSTDIKSSEISDRVDAVLDKVDLSSRARHFPGQLSGGQQQRVAVARALVTEPSIILADEPTGNLDSKNATRVLELLARLNEEGSTICMVTHDQRSADMANRNVQLLDGAISRDYKIDMPVDLEVAG